MLIGFITNKMPATLVNLRKRRRRSQEVPRNPCFLGFGAQSHSLPGRSEASCSPPHFWGLPALLGDPESH